MMKISGNTGNAKTRENLLDITTYNTYVLRVGTCCMWVSNRGVTTWNKLQLLRDNEIGFYFFSVAIILILIKIVAILQSPDDSFSRVRILMTIM